LSGETARIREDFFVPKRRPHLFAPLSRKVIRAAIRCKRAGMTPDTTLDRARLLRWRALATLR